MAPHLRRRLRSLLFEFLSGVLKQLFGRLRWGHAQRLGSWLGSVAWRATRRNRRKSLDHLTVAFPELTTAERRALGRACFRHLGTCIGELLHVYHRDPSEACRHVRVEGWEEIERIRARGRPIVVMTAHCGNWELLSTVNESHGLGVAAIARQLDDPSLDGLAVELRRHLGSVTIARGSRGSSRELLRALRRRGALVLLIDQDILSADGVWVPFFGRLARTPLAAANLALRLGAAVVPSFVERLGDGSHLVTFHPPMELPADPLAATAVMTARIEEQIRRCPEQWVWMHRRWRHRPPEDGNKVFAAG
ncbi:MAG: lipid A biosynthesis acyltransferase [bacterium]|nr:lipid A biosynthesis acyltransferase [bacterium]